MKKIFILVIVSLNLFFVNSNTIIAGDTNEEKLMQLSKHLQAEYEKRKAEAVRAAQQNGWIIKQEFANGTIMEIQALDEKGLPLYYITNNLNAAKTVDTDELWPGGSTGLNLTGSGISSGTLGEWDGGDVLTTHQELSGRVTDGDGSSGTSSHTTHVAGTIISAGNDSNAKGMAYQANLDAYDWNNDYSEMSSAAASGMILSNHSYGYITGWYWNGSSWEWYGDSSISTVEDYRFGFYSSNTQTIDNIAINAPYYLIVKSAGNDRNDTGTGSPSDPPPDGNGGTGYDCIGEIGSAKNILTIGSIQDITGGYSGTGSVVMESYSSWGPCDDGRIKPDIVANGQTLYSCDDDNNSDYTTKSGTSMSSPNATGTLSLLQEYYNQLHASYMKSATLKGLAINTANEAGSNNGPDYEFGWGLLNAQGAAELITNDNIQGGLINEYTLNDGSTAEYSYYSEGLSDINITICWTDPAGTPTAKALDPTTPMLVNDLDLRLTKDGTTYYPWSLDGSNPSSAATNSGDNDVDNVETITIDNPVSGTYTVRVSHKNSISPGQDYSLLVSGLKQGGPLIFLQVEYNDGSSCDFPTELDTAWAVNHDMKADTVFYGDAEMTASGDTILIDYGTLGWSNGDFIEIYVEADPPGEDPPESNSYSNTIDTSTGDDQDWTETGEGGLTLPVELSTFVAQYMNNTATLYWVTMSEQNNIGWSVYRSNEDNFSKAEKINNNLIDGYGTTTEPHDYTFTDNSLQPEPETYYYYWIENIDLAGKTNVNGPKEIYVASNTDPGNGEVPPIVHDGLYALSNNPFNPALGEKAKISFQLPHTSHVSLDLFNIKGQLIKNLYDGFSNQKRNFKWDGTNADGKTQQAGIYLYRLQVNGKVYDTQKIILIR